MLAVCVCVCVCVREREIERERCVCVRARGCVCALQPAHGAFVTVSCCTSTLVCVDAFFVCVVFKQTVSPSAPCNSTRIIIMRAKHVLNISIIWLLVSCKSDSGRSAVIIWFCLTDHTVLPDKTSLLTLGSRPGAPLVYLQVAVGKLGPRLHALRDRVNAVFVI